MGSCSQTGGDCRDIFGNAACCPPLFDGPGEPSNTNKHRGVPGDGCLVGMWGKDSGLGEEDFRIGCDVGCMSCDDQPDALFSGSDDVRGTRWMRVDEASAFYRDARGMIHDLRGGEFHQITRRVDYRRGKGWTNDGDECYGTHLCTYWGDNQPILLAQNTPGGPDDGTCGGIAVGALVPGILLDQSFFNGSGWPLKDGGPSSTSDGFMYCRGFFDNINGGLIPQNVAADHLVIVTPGGMNGLPIVSLLRARTNYTNRLGWSDCNVNFLVPCTMPTKQALSQKCFAGSYAQTINPLGALPDWYEENPSERAHFDAVHIADDWIEDPNDSSKTISNGPKLNMPEDSDPAVRAAVDVKNAVLRFIGSHTFPGPLRFDRIDAWHILPAGGRMHIAGRYQRGWGGGSGSLASLPEVGGVFGTCSLLQGGRDIACRFLIRGVEVSAMLTPHRLRSDDRIDTPPECEPHAVFRIAAECVVEAATPDGLKHSHPITGADMPYAVVNPSNRKADDQRFPQIVPKIDSIEYRNPAGVAFTPPSIVEWVAVLGGYSSPTVGSQRFNVFDIDQADKCSRFSAAWNASNAGRGVIVPGWRGRMEGVVPSDHGPYGGAVALRFNP